MARRQCRRLIQTHTCHEFPDMLYAEAKGCANGGKGTKRGFVTFAAKHSSREMSTFRLGLLDNLLDGLQFLT